MKYRKLVASGVIAATLLTGSVALGQEEPTDTNAHVPTCTVTLEEFRAVGLLTEDEFGWSHVASESVTPENLSVAQEYESTCLVEDPSGEPLPEVPTPFRGAPAQGPPPTTETGFTG